MIEAKKGDNWILKLIHITISPQTTRGGEDLRNVEAVDVETSNWVRFVNAPRNVFEENVVTRQCRDK